MKVVSSLRDFNKLLRIFPGGPVAKTPNAGGLGLIPGQGTRSHMLQLKILSAVTRPSRAKYINIFKREKKKKPVEKV